MKKALSAILSAVILLLSLVSCDDGVRYTDSVDDYNRGDYYFYNSFYLSSIPENATVVSFSYYRHVHENASDVYLELRFSTIEELEAHLDAISNHTKTVLASSHTQPYDGEWFFEVANPYDENYVDAFCWDYNGWIDGEKNYTGYSIERKNDHAIYNCDYGIVSYSVEDLTVIQARAHGRFEPYEEGYTPKYFKRFNIPTNDELVRRYYIENYFKPVE